MLFNRTAVLLALASSLAHAATAVDGSSPDKPAMNPAYNTKQLASNLQAHVTSRPSTKHSWNDGYIPKSCKNIAIKHKLDPNDFTVFDVTYDDCAQPWTMCHHKGTNFSESDMIEGFGSMPVHVRSYIR